ncbi:MAG: replication factor C small subunit [Edafosvirus sp.]|uniref:Replication factor C small subunit n=1 Tax=Edafosvirus sp. TaxID=2487765 RepID=A0A3G4ZTK6_9VIRU|nr:MAG: replication factor C small subunit [Edafosvirus sp.]
MLNFHELLEIETKEGDVIVEPEKKLHKNIKEKTPWVDKYRPKKLDDIVYQTEIIKMFKETLKTGNLPHLLFYGPPGTGKTSTVLAIANELFGPKKFSERVIELNASDERGINVVRYKIVTFAKVAIGNGDPNYLCPPYKIIILDEADAMTNEAQSALRKVMENSSDITRFCFICNYINKIIDPITSRCMKFRFKPINDISMNNKLKLICEQEELPLNNKIIDTVVAISKGDMRKGIMTLQNLKYIHNYQKKITVNDVFEVANYMPDSILDNIWESCILSPIKDINAIVQITDKIKAQGYPIHNILEQLINLTINEKKLNDKKKSLICMKIANTEKKLIEGANEYIQLLNVLSYIKGVEAEILDYVPGPIY